MNLKGHLPPIIEKSSSAEQRDSASSPTMSSRSPALPQPPNYTSLISAISNASIQYNLSVIAVALLLMDDGTESSSPSYVPPAYPRTSTQDSLLKSSVFVGAIIGQSVMGYAGDRLGRGRAMILTNFIALLGCLSAAACTWGSPSSVYGVLAGSRLLLGIGVGGKYPLASTIRAEGAEKAEPSKHKATEVAKGFFWQTPGCIFPYLAALLLVVMYGEDKKGFPNKDIVSVQFRALFALGAVPCAVVIYLTYLQFLSPAALQHIDPNADRVVVSNPLSVVRRHPELWRVLIGTGSTWFMYDFIYYGSAFAQPDIIAKIFGDEEGLINNCWQNILLAAMGLPGVLAAIAQMESLGVKPLMSWGFVAILTVCAMLSVTIRCFPDSNVLNFSITCLLIFSLNWGCNVATYVLPTEAFPPHVRSSLYGLSAAMGKVGACCGGYLFGPLSERYGYSTVFAICAALCGVGVVVTHSFVEPYNKHTFIKETEKKGGLLESGIGDGTESDNEGKIGMKQSLLSNKV